MKWGYGNGYAQGLIDGRLQALSDFERVLAVLREELGDCRSTAATQSLRADAAVDLLLGHLGARAISLEGQKLEVERQDRHVNAVRQLTSLSDPTEEIPYSHPLSRYKSEAEARVDVGEDVAVALTEG